MLRPPIGLYQPYSVTSDDRYPDIFREVRQRVADEPTIRILSFGCSTGEEVFALRRYFENSEIVGIDINPMNIALCRWRKWKWTYKRIQFITSGSAVSQQDSSIDVILAMAVFRHGDLNILPPPPRCNHRIRFADFENSVADLARTLKHGGLLVIQHAMFRFVDTSVAPEFTTLYTTRLEGSNPLYGPDDCILPDAETIGLVFCKTGQFRD